MIVTAHAQMPLPLYIAMCQMSQETWELPPEGRHLVVSQVMVVVLPALAMAKVLNRIEDDQQRQVWEGSWPNSLQ